MVSKLLGFAAQVAPWAVVSGLAYAAAFIKPSVEPLPLPQPLSEPRDLFYDVAGSGGQSFWFAANNGVVLQRKGETLEWTRHQMDQLVNLQGIATSPDGTVIAVGNDGWLFRNDGSGWEGERLPVSDIAGKLIEIAWIDNAFWAIGEMGAVFRIEANGETWSEFSIDGDVALNDIARSSDGDYWITAEFGTLFHSKDGGQTWSGEELGYESLRSIAFDGNTGVIVGNGGVSHISKDGGKSWQRRGTESTEHLYDVAHDGNRWLAIGNSGVLLSSSDGKEWAHVEPDGFSSGFHARLMPSPEGVLVAGSAIGKLNDLRWTTWPKEVE